MRCAPKPASPRRSAPPIPDWEGTTLAELTRTETFALTAIAYLQPVTRGEISKLAGREISRDIIAALKRYGLIDGAIRAPQPGAPFAYVTTKDIPGGVRLRLPARPAGPRTAQGRRPAGERRGGERSRQRARGHECRSRRHIRRQRRGVGWCRGIMKGSCAAPNDEFHPARAGPSARTGSEP